MRTSLSLLTLAPFALLGACAEETEPEVDTSATGGEAEGEVIGGTISDDMLPLESLTSTSPPARQTVTTSTTVSEDGETVETSVETVTTNSDAAPPAPPAPPGG